MRTLSISTTSTNTPSPSLSSHLCSNSAGFSGNETDLTNFERFYFVFFSFQKAFKQIAATIKLCFVGLSTFVVEFIIVFGSFCCFFYFVLSTKLRNFYDIIHTVENTIAMSIGKFNFGSLRAASEMAAWIFFVFSSEPYTFHDINKLATCNTVHNTQYYSFISLFRILFQIILKFYNNILRLN